MCVEMYRLFHICNFADEDWLKNEEIINIAGKFGFKFIGLNEYDFFTELQRSILIRKIIEYFPPSNFFFRFLGKKIPYIRMLKFKKM